MSRTVEWGPQAQYNITGQLNQHPRAAIAARAGTDRDNYVDFYDRLTADINAACGLLNEISHANARNELGETTAMPRNG